MANKLLPFLFLTVLCFHSNASHAQKARDSGKAVEKAIEKSKKYLVAEETELDLQSQFLYQYVQRKFDLEAISDVKLSDQVSQDHVFYPFLRLVPNVNPKVDSTMFENAGSGIDRLTLKSLYCDQFPLEDTFLDTLIEASEKGKYSLTHALWSIQLLRENGCLKSMKGSKQVTDEIAKSIAEMVNQSGFIDDIAIEGICFLYAMGRKDLVNPKWITIMAGHQNDDGGFYRTAKNNLPNTKTTVLALWCMLEYKTSGVKHEPWIR